MECRWPSSICRISNPSSLLPSPSPPSNAKRMGYEKTGSILIPHILLCEVEDFLYIFYFHSSRCLSIMIENDCASFNCTRLHKKKVLLIRSFIFHCKSEASRNKQLVTHHFQAYADNPTASYWFGLLRLICNFFNQHDHKLYKHTYLEEFTYRCRSLYRFSFITLFWGKPKAGQFYLNREKDYTSHLFFSLFFPVSHTCFTGWVKSVHMWPEIYRYSAKDTCLAF